MDALERVARTLARNDLRREGDEQQYRWYQPEAEAILRDLNSEGLIPVPRALLLQALAALERQPRRDPHDWWPGDAAARSKAKRALRKALGVPDHA